MAHILLVVMSSNIRSEKPLKYRIFEKNLEKIKSYTPITKVDYLDKIIDSCKNMEEYFNNYEYDRLYCTLFDLDSEDNFLKSALEYDIIKNSPHIYLETTNNIEQPQKSKLHLNWNNPALWGNIEAFLKYLDK